MFNILKDMLSMEKTIGVKLLATLLIITLTFANIILLGTYIGKGVISYANDSNLNNQDSSTNVSNVEFDVYFDQNDKSINTISKDINSEDLLLYAQVRVENGGVLNEAELTFEDTNFKIEQGTNLKYNTILAGQGATIEIPIKFSREGNTLNLGLLNMVSGLKLTGKYTNNKGKVEDIDVTKGVRVIWDASNISEEDNPAYVNAEVITNKVINIEEENKRVIQVLTTSGITGNKYPIKETNIQIDAPKINSKILPEKITVSTYEKSNWSYEENESNIAIKIENMPDNNNNVTWNKSGQDEFIITYIYPENTDVSKIELNANNNILLYDENKTTLNGEYKTEEIKEDIVNIVKFETGITNQAYKSNLNIGKNVEYATKWSIGISYSSAIEEIYINDLENVLYSGEQAETYANTAYLSSVINKEEFLKLFGEEGELRIYSGETLINIINSGTEDENGNIIISYGEDVTALSMTSSKPIAEGKLNIFHNKVLKSEGMTNEQIANITDLKYTAVGEAISRLQEDAEDNIILQQKETEANMKIENPVSFAKLGMDRTTLSTANVNNVSFTITLKTDSLKYDLYTNPVFEIEIPSYVKEVNVKNIQILNNNGLEPKEGNVRTNENGNKVICLELQGNQVGYGENTQLIIDTEMTVENLMPTVTDSVKLSFQNGKDTIYANENPINVIFESEQGFILANAVVDGNTETQAFRDNDKSSRIDMEGPAKEVTYKGTVVNNTDNDGGIEILGRIPFKGNKSIKEGNSLETTVDATLASVINVASKNGENINAKVYYSSNENATKDLTDSNNGWTENANTGVKSYLIFIPTLKAKDILEFTYNAQIPENLGLSQALYGIFAVYNGTDLIESAKVGLETQKQVSLELNVKSTASENRKVYERQEVLYTIEVKNTSEVAVNNVQINNPVPEGTTLSDENSTTWWTVDSLQPGETIQERLLVVVNETGESEESTITGITTVDADYLPEQLTNTLELDVEESNLKVNVKSVEHIINIPGDVPGTPKQTDTAELGADIWYEIVIKNESGADINNINIDAYFPDGIAFERGNVYDLGTKDESGYMQSIQEAYYDEGKKAVICDIDTIKNNQELFIRIMTKVVEYKSENIDSKVVITCDGESDEFSFSAPMKSPANIMAKMTSPTAGKDVLPGETIQYNIEVTNTGGSMATVDIKDNLPEELDPISIKYGIKGQQEATSEIPDLYYQNINEGETFEVEILATVLETAKSGEISNVATIEEFYGQVVKTQPAIVHTIVNDNEPEEPTNPDDPKTYKISGVAWLDSNKDGSKDENDTLLKGITVKAKENGQYLKDENGEDVSAVTDENGKYEISNLENDKSYVFVFDFDTNKYGVAENSDITLVTEDNTIIAKTDSIKINGRDVTIDIGLIENSLFDLRLDKYISKVTVKNQDGTAVHEYDSKTGKMAKIDVRSKYLQGTVVVVEYTIAVTNDGDVSGYAKSIVDYMPPDLTFSSELNINWYQDKDSLYCLELANEEIKPGETKEVKLVLSKVMTSNNTGLTSNSAEIYEDYNLDSIADMNSTPGNKEIKENDYSTADVIITLRTGGPALYVSIVIICMAILGRRNIHYKQKSNNS